MQYEFTAIPNAEIPKAVASLPAPCHYLRQRSEQDGEHVAGRPG